MLDSELDLSYAPPVLSDLLDAIESLRFRRQEERRASARPSLKRFTQQELTDEACPTYKNLLVGRSQRVPDRQSLLHIAHYLECTAAQRNELLLAARYLPETLELAGPALIHALEQARHLMDTLPYPAVTITHMLEVQALNDRFRRLFELPALATLPQAQRHLFHFLFHPDLLTRAHSTFNLQARAIWQAQAARGIQLFKHSNVLYQFEPWYQELVGHFCEVADFRQYWEQETEPLDEKYVPSKMYLSKHPSTGEPLVVQLRSVYLTVGSHRYPGVMAFFPLDEAAQEVFAALDRS